MMDWTDSSIKTTGYWGVRANSVQSAIKKDPSKLNGIDPGWGGGRQFGQR